MTAQTLRSGVELSTADCHLAADNEPSASASARTCLTIFIISGSVLMLELALTRILSFSFWSNYAYLVISIALLGFGISGVFAALWGTKINRLFSESALARGFAVTTALCYIAINNINLPFDRSSFGITDLPSVVLWEVAVVLPFFFGGLLIARLLARDVRLSGVVYGFDLAGAAIGGVVFVALLSYSGVEAIVFLSAAMAFLAALFLSSERRIKFLDGLLVISLLFFSVRVNEYLPLRQQQQKRSYGRHQKDEPILATKWSTLSRVDISKDNPRTGPLRGRESLGIWIDGGTNNSVMLKLPHDLEPLGPQHWSSQGVSFSLRSAQHPNVLIIGSAGGREVFFALSNNAAHVDAIEMDPSIAYFVNAPEFAEYMGGLFTNPRVSFYNDEGRSFLRRQPPESYDIIESVNNYTPAAMAAGALNLSETFLLTEEAFLDYWSRLKPNGIIAFHRGASPRLIALSMAMLRKIGVEHPERYFVVTTGEYDNFQGFLLKKGEWTAGELRSIENYIMPLRRYGSTVFLYCPDNTACESDHYYSSLVDGINSGDRSAYSSRGVDLSPTTDDKPFFEHYQQYGRRSLPADTPNELRRMEERKAYGGIPRGDFPFIITFGVALLLALLFIGGPLLLNVSALRSFNGLGALVVYFAGLGVGFIAVEIAVMKHFALFLGHPAASITATLVAILIGAGIGSIYSQKFKRLQLSLTMVLISLVIALIVEHRVSTEIFSQFLQYPFYWRVAVAMTMLVPLGCLLGMPFSLGLRLIGNRGLLAWAWGVNGFATVLGSLLALFIALFFGFTMVMYFAGSCYLVSLLAFRRMPRGVL